MHLKVHSFFLSVSRGSNEVRGDTETATAKREGGGVGGGTVPFNANG